MTGIALVANDNAEPLPTPGEADAHAEFEAKRMQVTEAYERAFTRR